MCGLKEEIEMEKMIEIAVALSAIVICATVGALTVVGAAAVGGPIGAGLAAVSLGCSTAVHLSI
jgi:hypothetical protein